MPFKDRRDNNTRNFNDGLYGGRGHTFAIFADLAGNYTVSLKIISPDGSDVDTDTDTQVVASDSRTLVECDDSTELATALGSLADNQRIRLTQSATYSLTVNATFAFGVSNLVIEAAANTTPVIEFSGSATTCWRFSSTEERIVIKGMIFNPTDLLPEN